MVERNHHSTFDNCIIVCDQELNSSITSTTTHPHDSNDGQHTATPSSEDIINTINGGDDLRSLRFMSPRYRGAVVHKSRGPMDDRPNLCTALLLGILCILDMWHALP